MSDPQAPPPASQRAPAPTGPTSDEGARREGGASKGPRRRVGKTERAGEILRKLITESATWTFLILIIEMAYFTAASPGKFLTATDLSLISQGAAPFLVMAIGQTFVIITAGIDLSVGFVLVLSGVVAGEYYLSHGAANAGTGTIWIGAIIGLAVGAGWGLLQGVLVAWAKIPPLIATLAGLGGAEGLSYLITGGSDVRVVPNKLVSSIGTGYIFGVQWLIVISFAATLVFGLVLHYTRFGQYTYAIGSNPEAAARAGIRVNVHLLKVYALSGLLSGLAGILDLAYFGTTTISGHPLDNLTVITAVVLGGASLFGGRGSMLGTLVGVFIPLMLATGLIIVGVNQYWQYIVTGAVLAAAVYLDQFRRRLRERL